MAENDGFFSFFQLFYNLAQKYALKYVSHGNSL